MRAGWAAWPMLALASLAGTGCATDQAADVAAYQKITDIAPELPAHRAGEPLTLVEAVRLANAYNERLAIEGEGYVRALAERQRRAAALRPTIDLFADVNLRENTGGQGSGGRVARIDTGLNAQYTLLTGLSDFRSLSAAESNIRARRWLLLDLREVLMLETARAYYEVLRAERLIDVLQSSMTVQAERLRDIRGRQQVGFARPLDVAQIEAQVSQTRVSLLDARNRHDNARAALKLLTGADVGVSPLTDGFEFRPPPASVEELAAIAGLRRQDLLAARATADAARSIVDAAIGRYYPSIGVDLDYFLTRETTPADLDIASLISIHLPIFSAGRIAADVREAWSVFRQSVLTYSLISRQVRRDVEASLTDYEASRQRADELRTQVAAAQEALRQAEASYQAGLGTNLERIIAQDQLLSAQLQAASEEFIYKVSYVALLRACGVLSADLAGAALPEVEPSEHAAPLSPIIRKPLVESKLPASEPISPGPRGS